MNKRIKNNKGITLVAVVVTVVILIILAGISINLILGDNGIITIAKKAKENTELAKIEEETELNELYTQLEAEGSSSGNLPYDSIAKLTEFKTAIANAIDEAGGMKPDITAETSVFADNINGIVKEVTKNATATADNISKGKTAWVNGTLITGNGKDNNSYYDDGKRLDASNILWKMESDIRPTSPYLDAVTSLNIKCNWESYKYIAIIYAKSIFDTSKVIKICDLTGNIRTFGLPNLQITNYKDSGSTYYNYDRVITFTEGNISINTANTSCGSYENYTIPIRIVGMNSTFDLY